VCTARCLKNALFLSSVPADNVGHVPVIPEQHLFSLMLKGRAKCLQFHGKRMACYRLTESEVQLKVLQISPFCCFSNQIFLIADQKLMLKVATRETRYFVLSCLLPGLRMLAEETELKSNILNFAAPDRQERWSAGPNHGPLTHSWNYF
jgi:hypothetical protein